jgi:hypothetical protein
LNKSHQAKKRKRCFLCNRDNCGHTFEMMENKIPEYLEDNSPPISSGQPTCCSYCGDVILQMNIWSRDVNFFDNLFLYFCNKCYLLCCAICYNEIKSKKLKINLIEKTDEIDI